MNYFVMVLERGRKREIKEELDFLVFVLVVIQVFPRHLKGRFGWRGRREF